MAATPLFVQAQSFALQASGASTGDTSITLQSFKLSDGTTNITTAMIGSVCFGTLEPNNGTQEEAIQFTGVTQNANGTATLTGVSSVGFISPYTATSGLSKSHAGGVTFILSNDAAFYGNIVTYINGVVASGASLASTTVAGISKLSSTPATGSNPIAVGDNDSRVLSQTNANYVNSIVNTGIPYATATGTSTAYTATLASSIVSLASGTELNFQVPTTNATSVTLNVNSLGAKPIRKNYNATLASGDLITGQIVNAVYDGANFQIVSPVATAPVSVANSGTTTKDTSVNTTTTINHGIGVTPKLVRVTAFMVQSTYILSYTIAAISNGTTSSIYYAVDGGTGTGNTQSTGFRLYGNGPNISANNSIDGTLSVNATSITITWSLNNTPTGTAQILWEVIG